MEAARVKRSFSSTLKRSAQTLKAKRFSLRKCPDSPHGLDTLGSQIQFAPCPVEKWLKSVERCCDKQQLFLDYLSPLQENSTELLSLRLLIDRCHKTLAEYSFKDGPETSPRQSILAHRCSRLNDLIMGARNDSIAYLLQTLQKKEGLCKDLAPCELAIQDTVLKCMSAERSRQNVMQLLKEKMTQATALLQNNQTNSLTSVEEANLASLAVEFRAQLASTGISSSYSLALDGKGLSPGHKALNNFLNRSLIPMVLQEASQVRRLELKNFKLRRNFLPDEPLKSLRHLSLDHCQVQSLRPLQELKGLSSFSLKECKLKRKGRSCPLSHLRQLPIKYLSLSSDIVLESKDLPETLISLSLAGTCRLKGPVEDLCRLNLDHLALIDTPLTKDLLTHLDLGHLRTLRLKGNMDSDTPSLLKRAQSLEMLDLYDEKIEASTWASLLQTPLRELKTLRIGRASMLALGALGVVAPNLSVLSINSSYDMQQLQSIKSLFSNLKTLSLAKGAACFNQVNERPFMVAQVVSDCLGIEVLQGKDLTSTFALTQ